jgi:hypothetical protein
MVVQSVWSLDAYESWLVRTLTLALFSQGG